MSGKDEYYNRSKQEGYRARSAYKLKQIDEAVSLFGPGRTVVDLGAAPGGWLQVASEAVGEAGQVVGVDRQRIEPLDGVETVRGDLTETATREAVRELVGEADVVLSDMAPEMTGEYTVDHARSVHLAEQALDTARDLLGGGGNFAAKVFDGPDADAFREAVAADFEFSRDIRPDASRDSSSELYVVGKDFLTAPVRAGDRREVAVEAVGDEGDGVAKIDGFTLFVPDTEPGDTVEVRVTEVKPRYGFAERVE
jgi:23S rRNA (uridine2552-2'-O)-methyltransferase